MTTTKCANPSCENTVPLHLRRRYSGCCSAECQRVLTRVYGNSGLQLLTAQPVAHTPTVQRKNARQNWKGTDRDRC